MRFDRIDLDPAGGGASRARVVLSWRGSDYVGTADVRNGTSDPARAAAVATLRALERITANYAIAFSLEDLVSTRISGADALVVATSVRRPEGTDALVGTCLVRDGEADAAVRAVLNSTNRHMSVLLHAA